MTTASLSIVVPSCGRPAELRRCLRATRVQMDADDQLVVVVREGDDETLTIAESSPRVVITTVDVPGYAAALHAGLQIASRQFVAFLDDDAVPHNKWIQQLKQLFQSMPLVGAVGGRIANFEGIRTSSTFFDKGPVAKVHLTGRLQSRLHQIPATRRVEDVDFLPGSNMSYRRELVNIPLELNRGMAGSLEIELALQVKESGYRILYDSDIFVEHYPAPRPDYSREDRVRAAYEASFVYMKIIQRHFPLPRRFMAYAWWILLGSRELPGILAWPYLSMKRRPGRARLVASYRGRRDAIVGDPSVPALPASRPSTPR